MPKSTKEHKSRNSKSQDDRVSSQPAKLNISNSSFDVAEESVFMSSVGLDIHESVIVACYQKFIPDTVSIEVLETQTGTTKAQLQQLVDWLLELNPEVILMESTGVYWQALYDLLEDNDLARRTYIVNARDVKAIKGKKSDRIDAARLATVARMGNVRNSFIPVREVRANRELNRHLFNLTRMRQQCMNRMHRMLNKIGARFNQVFSKITGVAASIVLDAVINDTPRNVLEEIIAKSCKRVHASNKEILEAVDIVNNDPTYKMILKSLHSILCFCDSEIDITEGELDINLRKHSDLINRLMTIPGVSDKTARTIVSELGSDWSAFGSSKRLASWLGLCPGMNESAGKRTSSATTHGNKYIRQHLIQAANAISRMKSGNLHSFFQSIKERRGHKRAVVATAHKLVKIMFAMARDGTDYQNIETVRLESQRVERAKRATEKLGELGYNVELKVTDSSTGTMIIDASYKSKAQQDLVKPDINAFQHIPPVGFPCVVNPNIGLFIPKVDYMRQVSTSTLLQAKLDRMT